MEEPNEEEFEKSTGRKESKSKTGVISGSLASCLVVISVVACVFWR